jgi:hypothetical protein
MPGAAITEVIGHVHAVIKTARKTNAPRRAYE